MAVLLHQIVRGQECPQWGCDNRRGILGLFHEHLGFQVAPILLARRTWALLGSCYDSTIRESLIQPERPWGSGLACSRRSLSSPRRKQPGFAGTGSNPQRQSPSESSLLS